MEWSCQGDLACWQEDGHWLQIWEERKGRATHQVASLGWASLDYLCQKKKEEERKKHELARQKQEGKKGELCLPPWMSLSLFSLPLVIFPSFFLSLSVSPLSHSCEFGFFLLCLIILSSSVSLRHVFQSLPSIDTVSTNSSPPVPRGKPPGKAKSWGKACWVWGDTGDKTERYRAFLHDNHCSSI